jgi:hypothetical protein
MSDMQEIVTRIHNLAQRKGLAPTTISARIFGSGDRLRQIEEDGSSISLKTLSKVREKLDREEAA